MFWDANFWAEGFWDPNFWEGMAVPVPPAPSAGGVGGSGGSSGGSARKAVRDYRTLRQYLNDLREPEPEPEVEKPQRKKERKPQRIVVDRPEVPEVILDDLGALYDITIPPPPDVATVQFILDQAERMRLQDEQDIKDILQLLAEYDA